MPLSSPRRTALLGLPILLSTFLAGAHAAATAAEWTRFRGPNGSGISEAGETPIEFGPQSARLWVSEVPFGRSSPVLAGNRVLLTAVVGDQPTTLAYDAKTGEELWRRSTPRTHPVDLHGETDSATATPATDGENVYVFFHEAGLLSYDADGGERWRVELGELRNFYGCASSPLVAESKVIVLCDQASGSFLLAVDAASGKRLWRVDRPARLESYATPILYPDGDSPRQIIVSGSRWVDAYELASGESAWTVPAVGTGPVASPVLVDDRLFVSAHDHADDGWPEFDPLVDEHDKDGDGELSPAEVETVWLGNHFGWLDNDADGRIADDDWKRLRDEVINDSWGVFAIDLSADDGPKKIWNYRQNVPYIPSPVVYDGVYYMVKDGIVTSLDAASGELLKRGRLPGTNKVYASPVVGDGKIYVSTLGGWVIVLDSGREWRVLADNEIGEPIHATPAVSSDGTLFVRSEGKLWAFGSEKSPATEATGR